MCTATWIAGDRFRCFLFNRDEKRSRPVERSPSIHAPSGRPRYLAPIDPESGGTWIAVSEYGMTVAVFNHYDARPIPLESTGNRVTSRGTLPSIAMEHRQLNEAAAAVVEHTRRAFFNPFLFLLQSPDGNGLLLSWDGNNLTRSPLNEVRQPVTTSSWHSTEVTASRRELFQKVARPPIRLDQLLEFHATITPDKPAHGPTMIRDDATTRSFSLVRIDPGDISMRHQHFNPESGTFESPTEVRIPRRF